jgi:pimeloyl-ACP methyl ester carboxylesterase
VAGDLADDGWSVTAADLRGHGESPDADGYSFSEYAADVVALGGPWDAVVGHSMGGAVAVLAHRLDPDFARRLVLQDPALLLADGSQDEVLTWLLQPYTQPLTIEAVSAESPLWDPVDIRIKVESLRQCGAEVVRATVADNRPWNVLEQAAAVTVPTTIIGSDPTAGGIMAITIGEWLAATNPLIRFRVVAGAEHSAHRQNDVYDDYMTEVRTALATGVEDG